MTTCEILMRPDNFNKSQLSLKNVHYIYQTLPSPRAILKAIRAGVGWVWDRD